MSGSHENRAPFFWELRAYFRQVAGLLVLGSIAGVLMNIAIVLPAIFLGRAINTVLSYERGHASVNSVAVAAGLVVLATAATEVPRVAKRWWLGSARARFQANVRSDALRGVLSWPMARLASMSVGEVMARVIGDVGVLGLGVGEVMIETWDTLLFSASIVVTMVLYAPGLAVLALAPVPLALVVAKIAGRAVAVRTTRARQSDADLTTVLHEQLGGLRLLRLSGRAGAAGARVQTLAEGQAAHELDAIRLDEALGAAYTVVVSVGIVFVIWLGGRQVASGALSVGGLIAFLQLFVRFVRRAPRIPQMANRVQAASAAYGRLRPLLVAPPPISEEPRWSSLRVGHVGGVDSPPQPCSPGERAPAALSFDHVGFTYPGATRQTIFDLDLTVAAGALVAVTGPVGAGKSALARLAAGIYAPDEGRVLVENLAVAGLGAPQRANWVGYLGQEPHLFSGSIAANVLLTAEGSTDVEADQQLLSAVRIALLETDLTLMPFGLRTEIGELGVRISGGQRQRVALARALAAGGQVPRLLVLDDPFSAVDVHTEALIVAALHAALGRAGSPHERATILLCSHRLAAFPLADEVVVVDRGRIEERGSHRELLEAGGLYARIYRAQSRLVSAS
ncbi:MAG: ABC transporter ATP-binding protein [Acidimicrobiales bacterium]